MSFSHFRPDVGVLFVRGRDAVSFIDGLSTNHIPNTPGSALRTVFTDRAAKVIAVATVMVREEGIVLLVHRERWQALLDHLTPRQLGQDVAMLDLSDRNHVVYRTGSRGPPSGTWYTEEGVTSARVHEDLSILVVAGSSKWLIPKPRCVDRVAGRQPVAGGGVRNHVEAPPLRMRIGILGA